MLVKAEAIPGVADPDALALALAAHLRDSIGVRLESCVVPAGSLPRYEQKTKRIFDTRTEGERPAVRIGRR
jgi:phenylacetate-CoA ligase